MGRKGDRTCWVKKNKAVLGTRCRTCPQKCSFKMQADLDSAQRQTAPLLGTFLDSLSPDLTRMGDMLNTLDGGHKKTLKSIMNDILASEFSTS